MRMNLVTGIYNKQVLPYRKNTEEVRKTARQQEDTKFHQNLPFPKRIHVPSAYMSSAPSQMSNGSLQNIVP